MQSITTKDGTLQDGYKYADDKNGYWVVTPSTTPSSNTSEEFDAKVIFTDAALQELKEVILPEGCTALAEEAFMKLDCKCYNLATVGLPSSLTTIGFRAFCDCTKLASVTIPESVTTIYSNAFENCTNLETVTFDGSNPAITSISECMFLKCEALKGIIIPDKVTEIGARAFLDCKTITMVTIPASVQNIRNDAFNSCTGLQTVTIKALQSKCNIKDSAFSSAGTDSGSGKQINSLVIDSSWNFDSTTNVSWKGAKWGNVDNNTDFNSVP